MVRASICFVCVVTVAVAAEEPRLTWRALGPGCGVLMRGRHPLVEVAGKLQEASVPWIVEGGRFRAPRIEGADRLAMHARPLAREDITVAADVTITEGDVAGLVMASAVGGPCYAVLLGARSRKVRIAYLPWPGRDLHAVPYPVAHREKYRLSVTRSATANGVRLQVSVNGTEVADYEDVEYKPAGGYVGVMNHSSTCLIEAFRVEADGAVLLSGEDFELAGAAPEPAAAEPITVTWADGALVMRGRFPPSGRGEGAQLVLRHHVHSARHVWVPHLAPEELDVMGDHAFRSPAVILANDEVVLVLVPDLDDVRAAAGWRAWLDYDHAAQQVVLAAGGYRVYTHVLYRRTDVAYAGQDVHLRFHVFTSSAGEDLANPYGLAARWIWQRWGAPRHREGGSQLAPLAKYAEYITLWAFSPEGWGETVWQEFTIGSRRVGAPAFIVDVAQHPSVPVEKRRWREQRSVWNQAWFSTQRCANGLFRYARLTGSKDLERRARLSTALALSAPQTDGLFPAVYTTARPGAPRRYQLYADTPDWDEGRWSNSDRRPPGVSESACHLVDAAFTARLLLEWASIVGGDDEVIAYLLPFADRLCRLQRPSGAFPGWVEPDGSVPAILAEGPESAMSAALLLELLARFPERSSWRQAAVRALDYLERDPVAQGRWEDFETYFSCCRWGSTTHIGKRVARQGVYKQNTFSPFWCAEAFLAAYRVLGEPRYLALGRRCLDELSLFQQVWDPPFIPAPCHGGFGVMNADGEWNDARQSLFAPLYLEYYRETGLAEYFERGVAALRASFAMLYCPENAQVAKQYELKHPMFGAESYGFMMENIAHGGPAPADGSAIGPFTIYTWGNGAALATAAKIRDLYGDVYVDIERYAAFGIDGCEARLGQKTLTVRDRYGRATLDVVFADGRRRKLALANGEGTLVLGP